MEFENITQLQMLIGNDLNRAVDYVVDKIVEEMQLQIQKYKIGTNNNAIYESTGEFFDAWRKNASNVVMGYATGEMVYDTSNMSLSNEMGSYPDNFIHGSNVAGQITDKRLELPDLIFQGLSGNIFGNGFWTKKRDAYTDTMKTLDWKFNKWLKEGMALSGFTLAKETL